MLYISRNQGLPSHKMLLPYILATPYSLGALLAQNDAYGKEYAIYFIFQKILDYELHYSVT